MSRPLVCPTPLSHGMFSSERFHLETLFCAEALVSAAIMKSHPSLQTLGIFGNDPKFSLPALGCARLLVLRIFPCRLAIKQDEVSLFPDLLEDSMNNPAALSTRLRTGLHADLGKHLPNPPKDVCVYLKSFENPVKLRLLLEAANGTWGDTPGIGLRFEFLSEKGLVRLPRPGKSKSQCPRFNSSQKQHLKRFLAFHRQSFSFFRSRRLAPVAPLHLGAPSTSGLKNSRLGLKH